MNKIKDFFNNRFSYNQKQEYSISKCSGEISYVILALLMTAVFIIYYRLSYNMLLFDYSDLGSHQTFVQSFLDHGFSGFKEAWIRIPYCAWHLIVIFFVNICRMPLSSAAALTYSIFGVISFLISYFVISRIIEYYAKQKNIFLSSIGAFVVSFVGPYDLYWLSPNGIYYGQFCPNPFHNPTHMAVKGIGLLCTAIGIDIFKQLRNENTIFFKSAKNQKRLIAYFSITLFISAWVKPTYMYMLLPAGFLFLLLELIYFAIKMDGNVKKIALSILKLILASLPALATLILLYITFYITGASNRYDTKVVIGPLFDTWHLFSYNVPTSILLAMFFPIWMCVTNPGYFLKSVEGRFAVICYIIGTLEFSIFEESGEMMKMAANFAWCMMAGMVVLYTVSTAFLIKETLRSSKSKGHLIYIIISWFLLFLHMYSGMTTMFPTLG